MSFSFVKKLLCYRQNGLGATREKRFAKGDQPYGAILNHREWRPKRYSLFYELFTLLICEFSVGYHIHLIQRVRDAKEYLLIEYCRRRNESEIV